MTIERNALLDVLLQVERELGGLSTASSGHSGTRVEKHAQLHLRASQPLGGRGEDEVQEVEPAIDQRLGFGLDGLAADRAAGMELEIGGGLVGFDQQQVDAGLRQRLGRGLAIAEEPGDFLLNLGHMRLRGSALVLVGWWRRLQCSSPVG